MKEIVREFLTGVKVGAKQSHGAMTLYCLLAARETQLEFVILEDALATGGFSVTEAGEGGYVPELRVKNNLDRKVLMIDGEELVGAKQNRVLNVSILVPPKTECVIPVSCVEQGRWSYRSREFSSERRQMSADLRRRKAVSVHRNLAEAGYFHSDQGEVWRGIDAKFASTEAPASPTMAMSDLYDGHRDVLEDYLKAFQCVETQIGIAVFIGGVPAGFELMPHFASFRKYHGKMVQSYAVDALEQSHVGERSKGAPTKPRVQRMLDAAARAPVERRESVALGHDIRLISELIIAAALEFEGDVLHMSIFPNEDPTGGTMNRSSMRRASQRRNFMRS